MRSEKFKVNLANSKFLEFKKENKEDIREFLKYCMICDLKRSETTEIISYFSLYGCEESIWNEHEYIERDNDRYVLNIENYNFYNEKDLMLELEGEDIKYDIILNSNKYGTIYAIEGKLRDKNNKIINKSLNHSLEEFLDLILNNNYLSLTNDRLCRIYAYFLKKELLKIS